MRRRPARTYIAAALSVVIMAGLFSSAAPRPGPEPEASSSPAFAEPYRPQVHFTPDRNWMNDPNGLLYHEGEYHLFFQYNPDGTQWGNISWGHAVSPDLVHWTQLPLAISHDDKEMVFSGSAVIDHANTSGFGTADEPAMVAVYTRAPKAGGHQAQSLAYSTDRGRTWTKYVGNPVLDVGSGEFRDPKVQWYAPTKSWLMAVVLATERKVRFYSSKDLKSWTHLSDFGPAGAVGGVWECPDLFALPVDGETGRRKWVLIVSLNPGGIQGGSATQYFVGDFDGKNFTADDDGSYPPPAGSVVQGFEGTDFADWTTTGTAFGPGPSAGGVPEQHGVTGFLGERLANSFHGGDAPTGTLISPPFTAREPYLNFLVGGGYHPTSMGNPTAVNLLVDGTVVQSVTGPDSGVLDWAHFDLRAYQGKEVQIQLVDNNTGGWGHIMADHFVAAETPALDRRARELGRLRQGLLCRHLFRQRARWQAIHDRLDEQLAVRR